MIEAAGPRGESRPQAVYYYATCLVDLFFPEAGLSGIRLLQREGLRVIFPPGQTCCAQPAYNCGEREHAREVARAQIRLFREPHPIVVPSGSCAAMMKHHYPDLFTGDPLETEARAVAGRVYELTEFLADVLAVRLIDCGPPVRVTWHSSCHALREMEIVEQPRRLLAQLQNVEVLPLARERECCGFGGTFCVREPEISAAMAEDKAADAVSTGAAILLSGDGGCLMNIGGLLERRRETLAPRHVAQFLWDRTRER